MIAAERSVAEGDVCVGMYADVDGSSEPGQGG